MNKSLVALHLHHQLSVLEVTAILIDVHSCIPLFSFCSSVNIVSCLLVKCISSLVRCLLGSFAYFKIRLFLFLFFFFVFWIQEFFVILDISLYQICVLRIFSSSVWLVIPYSLQCLLQSQPLNLIMANVIFFLSWIMFLVYEEFISKPKVLQIFSYFFSLEVLQLCI